VIRLECILDSLGEGGADGRDCCLLMRSLSEEGEPEDADAEENRSAACKTVEEPNECLQGRLHRG
jgi:hypothetical protein